MTNEQLKQICKLTVDLTKLRQAKSAELPVEIFAPLLFGQLVKEFNKSMKS